MVTKRQHYVPKFYLENFLVNEDQLFWVYSKKTKDCRQQSPINTAVKNHLYSSVEPDGSKDDFLEREVFSKIESVSGPILVKWVQPYYQPSFIEVLTFAGFLGLAYLRVPGHIEETKEVYLESAAAYTRTHARMMPQYQALANIQASDLEMPKHDAVRLSLQLFETVYNLLGTMRWRLCTVPDGKFLVTSDHPLCIRAQNNKGKFIYGKGFGHDSVEVSFALSPKKFLLIDRDGPPLVVKQQIENFAASSKDVDEMNRRCILQAHELVISPYKTDDIDALVRKHSPLDGKMMIDEEEDGVRLRVHSKEYDF